MSKSTESENTTQRKPQSRGLARRKKILDTAKAMLIEHEEINLSIYDIAKRSGIPASSIYHFFPKTNDIFRGILDEYLQLFDDSLSVPIDPKTINHWSDIGYTLEQRMVDIYNDNILARRMILGQHAYGELLSADQQHDQAMGEKLVAIYNRFYQLPALPEDFNIFTIALQLSDKVYAMSHQNTGEITAIYANEGWQAAKAYLSIYLPQFLARQPQD